MRDLDKREVLSFHYCRILPDTGSVLISNLESVLLVGIGAASADGMFAH